MPSNRLILFAALPTAVLILAGAFFLKPVSAWYLRHHHSTMLGTMFALLAPPDDFYSTIASEHVRYGEARTFDIEFRYAGGHLVYGSMEGPINTSTRGHLSCGDMSIDIGYRSRIYSLSKGRELSNLGHFIVDGPMVGRIIRCEMLLHGQEGDVERIAIAKVSDL
ncbi:hypothetical protein ACQQ2N_02885 [Dokdonella sp. MW10]|uniref:hypothetical protein n=1 Tax=Dokdonella sp. MW10 TaxID=2992926 RepID=UPI003F7CD8DE